jgi:uncharacterized membrane protein
MTAGIFWMGHSAQYTFIEKSDRNLNWINLLFLLLSPCYPFLPHLGDYIEFKFPIGIYWFNIFAMGLLLYFNWHYACKRGFVSEEMISKWITASKDESLSLSHCIYLVLCFVLLIQL